MSKKNLTGRQQITERRKKMKALKAQLKKIPHWKELFFYENSDLDTKENRLLLDNMSAGRSTNEEMLKRIQWFVQEYEKRKTQTT